MLILTVIVSVLLFGVLGPWLMGRVDRFLDAGGFPAGEEAQDRAWTPSRGRKSA